MVGWGRSQRRLLQSACLTLGMLTAPQVACALTLKEALAVTVESNPEIGQAVENREAIEFELDRKSVV